MKSSAVVIYNPAARKASDRKIELATALLREEGFSVEVLRTEARGHARKLAAVSLTMKPRLIIAAGGDGTVNEVINGMVWSDTPLALLPLGTTNVLAKELGIPEDIRGAVDAAVTSEPRRVSLGVVEVSGGGEPGPRFFCLMAGIGLDGKAVHDVNSPLKKVSGKAAYILSGIYNILGYAPERLSLTIDGREYFGYTTVIGKAAKYGGNFKVTPDANLLDPSLFVCLFKGGRRRDLFRYAVGVIRGVHLSYKDVVYVRAAEVEVRGTAHVQVDGDYLGLTPAKVTIAKDSLMLVYGKTR
jgi:diacylglycerol kinase (ATP)